jgi:hypothetical protein
MLETMQRSARVLIGLLLASGVARAQTVPLPARAYSSPTGAVTLTVDPVNGDGSGAANYRCLRGKKLVWQGKREYALWEAVVCDDGSAAGYSYDKGLTGGHEVGDGLRFMMLDARGNLRLSERRERTGVLGCVGPQPTPTASGLFLDPDNDRVVLRVCEADQAHEEWQEYSLSGAERGKRYRPREALKLDQGVGDIRIATAVPGTGLVLALLPVDKTSLLLLLEKDLSIAASLVWPAEQAGFFLTWMDLMDESASLEVEFSAFTVRTKATRQDARFEIQRAGPESAWSFRLVERASPGTK